MATTPQDLQAQEQEFSSAFAEPDVQRPEVDEDTAFGLGVPDEPAADTTVAIDSDDKMKTNEEAAIDDAAQAAAEEGAQPAEGDATGGEEMAAEAGAAEGDPAGDDMPTDPKELQRMKSWEGRLKARERELEARAAELQALADKAGQGDQPAPDAGVTPEGGEGGEAGESQAVEAVEAAVEAVQDGEMTAEQAMATLTEDFGPEFARMLKVLIKSEAGQVAGKVSENIESLVSAIKDDKTRAHFEAIADAHPDFHELSNSEDMTAYLDSLDETAKAEAMRVVENGSTRQVIRMLDQFKDWRDAQKAPVAEDPPAVEPPAKVEPAGPSSEELDAAEGVRSTGLRLPDQPARSDDYEAAWSQF